VGVGVDGQPLDAEASGLLERVLEQHHVPSDRVPHAAILA
jgi:hypothetical protein